MRRRVKLKVSRHTDPELADARFTCAVYNSEMYGFILCMYKVLELPFFFLDPQTVHLGPIFFKLVFF